MSPQDDSQTSNPDQDFLDEAFERAVRLLEEGLPLDVQELLDGHDALREQVERLVRLAEQVTIRPSSQLPTVSGYTLLHELGRGGMGTVYLARQQRIGNRPVALKVLPPASGLSRRARRRFSGEALAIGKLQHPNIVAIYDVIEDGDALAYAMEWVDGQTLADMIGRVRCADQSHASTHGQMVRTADPTNIAAICRLGTSIARALAAVHRAGLVHRDVKPSNILVRNDGTALLSDFGLVRETDSTITTQPGHFAGTVAYAAPEQLHGEHDSVDARGDVYSLGVTLYHALASSLPFQASDPGRMLRELERGPRTTLRQTNPRVPRDLETIVAKAMDANPARRYQSADDFADDLDRLLNLQPIHARPAGLVTRTLKLARRNRRSLSAAIAGGVLALILAASAAAYWFVLPHWSAEHLCEARLALLSPDHANNIISGVVWDKVILYGSAAWEVRRREFDHALTEYDAAIRLSPFDEAIRAERDVVAAAKQWSYGATEGMNSTTQASSSRGSPAAAGRLVAPALLTPTPRSTGLLAFLTQDYETALKDWARFDQTRATFAHPDPLVDAALGILYLFDDQAARAYPRLQKAVEAFPNVGFLMEYLADAAARCGDTERARRWLEESKHMPRRDDVGAALRINAGVLAAEGRTAEAIEAYQSVPQKELAGIELAKLLEREGRLHEAAMHYARLSPVVSNSPRIRAAFMACADRWWAGMNPQARLRMIRATLDEPPHAEGSFVGLLRRYVEATERRSDEATLGKSQQPPPPPSPTPSPPSLSRYVAPSLFAALAPPFSSPSLQSLSLSELAELLEVEDMSHWKRITSYPRIPKELQFAAWRSRRTIGAWGLARGRRAHGAIGPILAIACGLLLSEAALAQDYWIRGGGGSSCGLPGCSNDYHSAQPVINDVIACENSGGFWYHAGNIRRTAVGGFFSHRIVLTHINQFDPNDCVQFMGHAITQMWVDSPDVPDLVFTGPPGATYVTTSMRATIRVFENNHVEQSNAQFAFALDGGGSSPINYFGPGVYSVVGTTLYPTPVGVPVHYIVGQLVGQRAFGYNDVGVLDVELHPPVGEPVFDLPPGYTANCPTLRIVDNYWMDPRPAVTDQPDAAAACSSGDAAFFLAADGMGPLAYRWRKNGIDLSDGLTGTGSTLSGATTAMLQISGVTVADVDSYDCIVSNVLGAATSNAAALTILANGSGDGNVDGLADGIDIQRFVDIVVQGGPPSANDCAYDMNSDSVVNDLDVQPFVALLIAP